MGDVFEDPAWQSYAARVRRELIPMIKESAVTMALCTGHDPDPKMAVELGYMILLDKPIIAVVTPGSHVPRKLAMVADAIVEADLDSDDAAQRIADAIKRVTSKTCCCHHPDVTSVDCCVACAGGRHDECVGPLVP